MKKVLALVLCAVLALGLVACANGGSDKGGLPKNIEVQLPAKAGGGTDVVARAIQSYQSTNSGSNFTIVNNTDGSGVVAMETVRSAKADGSKILFFHSTMAIKTATGVYDKSASGDFKVIACGLPTNPGGYVLVVPVESGITDVESFKAAASAAGGNFMIGVETGGSSHIMSGMLSQALGVDLKYVEAGSDTDKLTALVGGSINCALVNANQAKQYVEGEKVRAIAVFSATEEGGRNSVLPDVPSFVELGYKCVFGTYFYVLGPKDMSDDTAKALYETYVAATKDAATAEVLEKAGMGMNIAPYEDGAKLIAAQETALNEVCAALGLAK